MDLGHWQLAPDVNLDDQTFGFIYCIQSKLTARYYIGKKQCFSKLKKKPLKGKKRKRIEIKSSTWRDYTGSSADLNDAIIREGKQNFTFTIIKTCRSKWELAYDELVEQMKRNVLLDELSFNGIMHVRIGRKPKSLLD